MKKYLYAAYGSNMNLQQMSVRCPGAVVLGTGMLNNYKLTFSTFCNIEHSYGDKTQVVVWEITAEHLAILDRYEGYPVMYDRTKVIVQFGKGELVAHAYIMNAPRSLEYKEPTTRYLQGVLEGAAQNGLDVNAIVEALADSLEVRDGAHF